VTWPPVTEKGPPGSVPGTLIYDGNCGFCRRSLRQARSLGATCAAEPFQSVDLAACGLTEHEASAAAWYVAADHRWHGHEAVAMVLRSSRHLPVRWLGRAVGSRALRPLASRIYEWVAANRHRLP
jgi:predicted DCC family thiol-disulfide oxidoreductase YuxK